MFIIINKETGTEIVCFDTFNQALQQLKIYENEDKKNKTYTNDFYEIIYKCL